MNKVVVPLTIIAFLLAYTRYAGGSRRTKDVIWVVALLCGIYAGKEFDLDKIISKKIEDNGI